jgi:outer membrane protein OmpA-like peptidoglycan-associated protein
VPPPVAQTITFTDTTLVDGQASLYYSDYLLAKTLYGGVFSGQNISYALYGNLPAGISFANSTGVLSGLISRDTIPGYYPLTVAAFSNGYATEVLNLNWRVLAAPVVTVPTPTPTATAVTKTPVSVATLSILFTDTTLTKGIVGRTYTDYVQAKTFSGNTFTEEKVSYSLAGALPTGLTFSTSTGYISGIISNGVIPGVYKVLVSAFSKGYPTQMYPYDFTVVSGTTIAVTASPAPSVTPSPIPSSTAPSKSTTDQLATMALMNTIWFDLGKSLLTTSAKASLNQMITKLVQTKYKSVVVNGFTDAVKGQPHPTLSLARANAVRSYILARTNGIMVSASGLGMAASSANSSSAMQESRKADIWVG